MNYELRKGGRIGPGKSAEKEGRALNRPVRWTHGGLESEVDPRQAEKLIESIGLSGDNVRRSVATALNARRTKLTRRRISNRTSTHPIGATVPGATTSGLIGQTSNTLPKRYVVGCHHRPTWDRMRSNVCVDSWWAGNAWYSNTLGNEHRHWNATAIPIGRGAPRPEGQAVEAV